MSVTSLIFFPAKLVRTVRQRCRLIDVSLDGRCHWVREPEGETPVLFFQKDEIAMEVVEEDRFCRKWEEWSIIFGGEETAVDCGSI